MVLRRGARETDFGWLTQVRSRQDRVEPSSPPLEDRLIGWATARLAQKTSQKGRLCATGVMRRIDGDISIGSIPAAFDAKSLQGILQFSTDTD